MAKKEINERVRPIEITMNETGEKFTLEFSREAVRFAEARGFSVSNVGDFPMTKVPDLFYFAFRMHHKNVSRERTDRILFDEMGGMPDGMLERLINLYSEPFTVFNRTDEDGNEKNSKVTVAF